MCDMCDNPSLQPADVRGRLVGYIAETGWALQHVEAGDDDQSFTYTIGLTGVDLPELLVHGLSRDQLSELNEVAQDCIHGLVRAGSSVEIGAQMYQLLPQPDTDELLAALDLYGTCVRVLRLTPMAWG